MGIKFNNKNLLLSNAASEHTTASGGPEDPSSEGAVSAPSLEGFSMPPEAVVRPQNIKQYI